MGPFVHLVAKVATRDENKVTNLQPGTDGYSMSFSVDLTTKSTMKITVHLGNSSVPAPAAIWNTGFVYIADVKRGKVPFSSTSFSVLCALWLGSLLCRPHFVLLDIKKEKEEEREGELNWKRPPSLFSHVGGASTLLLSPNTWMSCSPHLGFPQTKSISVL